MGSQRGTPVIFCVQKPQKPCWAKVIRPTVMQLPFDKEGGVMALYQDIDKSRELHQQAFDRLWASVRADQQEDLLVLMRAYVLLNQCWVDSIQVLAGLHDNEQN